MKDFIFDLQLFQETSTSPATWTVKVNDTNVTVEKGGSAVKTEATGDAAAVNYTFADLADAKAGDIIEVTGSGTISLGENLELKTALNFIPSYTTDVNGKVSSTTASNITLNLGSYSITTASSGFDIPAGKSEKGGDNGAATGKGLVRVLAGNSWWGGYTTAGSDVTLTVQGTGTIGDDANTSIAVRVAGGGTKEKATEKNTAFTGNSTAVNSSAKATLNLENGTKVASKVAGILTGGQFSNTVINVKKGATVSTKGEVAIFQKVSGAGELNIAGKVDASGSTETSDSVYGTAVEVHGGNLTVEATAEILGKTGNAAFTKSNNTPASDVNGATNAGIAVCTGSAYYSGVQAGTVTIADGAKVSGGTALLLATPFTEQQKNVEGEVKVVVNGGTFTGTKAIDAWDVTKTESEPEPQDSGDSGDATSSDGNIDLLVKGGTFSGSVKASNDDSTITGLVYGGEFTLANGDTLTDANGVIYTASADNSKVTLTPDSTTEPKKVANTTFSTGTIKAAITSTSSLTSDKVTYTSTEKDGGTVTFENGKPSDIAGTVVAKILKGSENGVSYDNVTYTSTDATNGGTVTFVIPATDADADNEDQDENGGNQETKTPAVTIGETGTVVATLTGDNVKEISAGDLGYTGVKGATITFVSGVYSTSKGKVYATATGALTGKAFTFGDKTYTVTVTGGMVFTLTEGVVTGISGLNDAKDAVSGDFTKIETVNDKKISIAGDTTVEIVGKSGGITALNNVSGNVTISGAAITEAKITTDAVGSFKLGSTAAISVTGDKEVTFTLGTDTAVSAVTNFDEKGTISGNLNGIAFTSAAAIGNTAKLNITKDTDFAVVNDGSALYLANISNGAIIANAGGMKKVVTDEAGTFSFGSAQKVTVTGDSSVEFTVDATNSTVTAVDSIASATLSVSSDTTSISINGGDAITFTAADKKTPTFVIDSNGKITEVSGASVVSGLTGDVNVIETSSAKIGTTDINITGDTSYAVSVVSGAVGEISSVSANATVSMANATINTDQNGKFTFGGVEYNIAGDNDGVKIVTGADSLMSAVTGLEGTIKTADKTMTINGEEVKIEVASADAASVVTYDGGTAGIDAITGLTNNATVTGATGAALNLVGTTSTSVATSLTANGNLFQLLNDSDGVTITGGEVVTGLAANASLIASNAGTYTVNGTTLTVAAGDVVRGADGGLTAEIYDPSNVAEVNESVAAAVESLASAIINTEDYEDLSKDTTKLAEVTEAINSTSASADKSALNGDMKFAVSVPSGSTSQAVDLSANTGKKDVTLTTGNQSLKFNNEGGNVAEIGKDATGEKTVELGNGGDVVAIAKGADKKATINITAGTGPDTVVSGANASVDVGKGGATKVRAVGGATVTMNNYSAADSKAGVQTTNSDIAAAIGNGNITLENGVIGTSEGKVALNSGSASADVVASADSGDTEGSTIANLYNNAGKMTKVGFTHNDGGTVDLSGQKANTVIQGNNAATNKSGESTLLGGSGNDTIFAGSGDAIDAGAGANTIVLKDASSRSSDAEKGATIAMTSSTGRNKVQNFNTGFEDGKDAISVDLTNAKFSIDGDGNLIVKNGRAKTTVESAASTSGDTSADATDGVANVLITDSSTGTTTKTAVAGEGKTISVSNDEESFANSYIGDGSGLSFSSYESEVNLNLAGTTATFGGEDVEVSGINNVVLGEADATVFGSDAKEIITAGNGNETIWAGAGKDLLNGFSGKADDKSGAITFGFMAGDGKDTITNFGFLTTENAQTADRVWTTGTFDATLSDSDVVLSFSGNKKDSLRITGAKGQNIQLSENGNLESVTTVLQVSDTLLTYDGLATRYVATGSNAAVVASSLASSANIWLEDKYVNLSNNTTYTGKITAINAAAVEGQATLVGNSYNNVITGAQGSSSMWGGDSTSNDTLIGGTEGNMFFYGVTGGNEGNDSISGITEDDTVNLFGIQLSDIDLANTSITNSAISLKFNAGGSLTMGNNGQTFMLANDQNQRYTYDKENSEWTKA